MLNVEKQQIFKKMARRLSEPESFLYPTDNIGEYGVMVKRNGWKKPVLRLTGEAVNLFLKNDWLQASQNRKNFIVLSEAGAKCYRRLYQTGGYMAQHQQLDLAANGSMVDVNASPINWLRCHRGKALVMFTEAELSAAERLNRDYNFSLAQSGMVVDLTRSISGGKGNRSGCATDLPDGVLDAARRVDSVLIHVGEDLADILKLICLQELGLEAAEKKLGWPRRSGKLVLKIALRRLVLFYEQ